MRRGITRGLRFSGVVTIGNCADLGPADFVEFYLADDQTRVIGMYIETARDGRRLFEILREAKARKPVVILKGGRTQLGTMAAASHTGSLAGDDRAWVALSRQTGCVLVETLDEYLDTLLTFQALTPQPQQPDAARGAVRQRRRRERARDRFFRPLRLDVAPFDQPVARRAGRAQAAAGDQHHQPGRYAGRARCSRTTVASRRRYWRRSTVWRARRRWSCISTSRRSSAARRRTSWAT